ncbi:MAG: DUF3303 family protein [Candidatus Hodarchaeales archaeon]|jgi:hypothetical protein
MARYVTITRWTPQTARALNERYASLIDGSAPKEVLDGWNKINTITLETSLNNRCSIHVYEVKDEDNIAAGVVSYYFQDVCTQETFPVLDAGDYAQVWTALPLDQIPKPKPWVE